MQEVTIFRLNGRDVVLVLEFSSSTISENLYFLHSSVIQIWTKRCLHLHPLKMICNGFSQNRCKSRF